MTQQKIIYGKCSPNIRDSFSKHIKKAILKYKLDKDDFDLSLFLNKDNFSLQTSNNNHFLA